MGLGSSLRQASVNQGLLRYAASVAPKHGASLELLNVNLPLFNQDDEAAAPAHVVDFRKKLKAADGVLVGAGGPGRQGRGWKVGHHGVCQWARSGNSRII